MLIKWGNYPFPANEAGLITHKQPLVAPNGLPYGVKETWQIHGMAIAADQASLLVLLNALEAAFAVNFQTIQLIGNDSTTVLRFMRGRTKIGGTVVTDGVNFPEGGETSAEFQTYRHYTVTVEGTYEIAQGNPLIAWDETLMLSGGKRKFVLRQPLNAPPVRQQVAVQTPFRASQRGSATYLYQPGPAASPLFPDDLHEDIATITRKSPQRSGGSSGAAINWQHMVEWAYEFESPNPLSGRPHFWPG